VAAFYADECFPMPAVDALRRRGHDVLTAAEAGHANQRVPDHAVLAFATRTGRAVLTLNRRDFISLHDRVPRHAGIAVCTEHADADRLAAAIDAAVGSTESLEGALIRITRPA
jgi:hypothetical protein